MLESFKNLKTSQIRLGKPLCGPDSEWIVRRVRELRAVAAADFREEDSRLVIEYDADLISGDDLVELINACGLRPQLPERCAERHPDADARPSTSATCSAARGAANAERGRDGPEGSC